MSTHTDHRGPRAEHHEPLAFDREIDVRGVAWTGAGIVGITILSILAMWALARGLGAAGVAGDRPLLPVEQAQKERVRATPQTLQGGSEEYDAFIRAHGGAVAPDLENTWPSDVEVPPAPRVQYAPLNDWIALRLDQAADLDWGWAGADRSTARVPVERAMGYVLESGLLRATPAPPIADADPGVGPFGALGGSEPATTGETPEPAGRAEESGAQEPPAQEPGDPATEPSDEAPEPPAQEPPAQELPGGAR